MARRKIIWSHRARIKLLSILEFYAKRNRSKTYSAKLYKKLNKEIKLLSKYPHLGIKTELESIRGLIVGEYVIYYEITALEIVIHTIWDSRQDPNSLTY